MQTQWYSITHPAFDRYGMVEDEALLSRRLPPSVAQQVSEGVLGQCGFGAGVRVRFETDSPFVAIRAKYAKGWQPTSLCACLVYGFDLYRCDEHGVETFVHTFRPDKNDLSFSSFEAVCQKAGPGFYTLNFPGFSEVAELEIGLAPDAKLGHGMPYSNELPVLFYGSSITHGAAASRPGNSYEGFLSQTYNLNYINLGFAGNAKGEAAMAEHIASRAMHAFVCDYDHNAPDAEHLRRTHYPFYQIIRQLHPNMPYFMVSKPDFRADPEGNACRREVIRQSFERARAEGDEKVYFIDGETLLAGEYAMSCTVDGCHPTDLGFLRMAKRIAEVLKEAGVI